MERECRIHRLAIEGEFTIFNANALSARLLSALQGSEVLEVDLAGVTEMDSAGLQLVIAIKREAEACNKSVRLIDCSPAVIEALDLSDLTGYFGVPVLIPKT